MSDETVCQAIGALRARRHGFDYNFHNRVADQESGLYAFWLSGGACLYVGMSTNIAGRLRQHRMQEHNLDLARYFNAFGREVEVSYAPLSGRSSAELRYAERRAIKKLRPLTNKQR